MSETAAKSKIDAAIDRVAVWTLGIVASAILFAMMTLAFVDVWGRYLLRQPVFGGYEVTEFLMGVLIFASLPLLCAREGHVTIDILDHVIPKRLTRWQRLFVNLVSAGALGVMSWQLYLQSRLLAGNNEVTMTLKIPHAPFALGFSVMAAVAALACLANAWGYLRGTRTASDTPLMTLSLIAFASLLALCFARIPIAFAMGIVGFVGFWHLRTLDAAFSQLAQISFVTGINYELSVLPLFILMGNFVTSARLSEDLYRAANGFLGHRRGGLAMATVVACGGFASVCGSSMATAATMAKVAMPSMRGFGYSDRLATGSIAAGGTLGILIPPSTIMVIYGIMTQTNIGKLFAAGVLPGIVGILFYLAAVQWVVRTDPSAGPPGKRQPWAQRMRTLADVWGVVALFLLVMVGIYGGIFTPTEAAGIGASGAFLFALYRRELSWKKLFDILLESAVTTAMLFMVLIGATLFSDLINQAGFAEALQTFVRDLGVNRWGVILAIIIIYIILGCVLESLSMVLLTVPVFFPLVMSLGFDQALGTTPELVQVWFGVLVVVVVEISLLTPPVGLNVFVLRSVLPEVSTGTIFRGVMPFFVMDIFRIAVLASLPIIAIWLPSHMR